MSVFAPSQSVQYEQTLLELVRTLPPSRIAQLLDFAQFLAAQAWAEELTGQEDRTEVEADNKQWDELFVTEEAQLLLNKLADEALAEHRAGKTKPMAFRTEGRIVPG